MSVNMDFIGKGKTQGEVASMGRLDPNRMRPYLTDDGAFTTVYKGGDPHQIESYAKEPTNNATLRRDEWKALDEAAMRVAETRLKGIQDLRQRGLVYNLGNAMGTTVLESHAMSDALEAELSMGGEARGQNDRVNYTTTYLPIPVLHVDYEINERVLAASRSLGNPLDTTMAERASRKVAEKLESMLFSDKEYEFGGGKIQSYVNFDDRNTSSSLENSDWTHNDTEAKHIIADVLEMKQESMDNHYYGPWVLYVPTEYETKLDEDYDNTRGNTIRERILAISGIEDVKVVDTLANNNVLLVQMTPDVVRLVQGMGIQNVQWSQEGGMISKFKVMTIQVPQIRSDYNGKCGIVHAT